MKKLFSIPLLGAGTADVESFASYIHRIAFEHGLFVGELLRYIYEHSASTISVEFELPKVPRYVRPESLLRPNLLVDSYVLMTGLMTSQDLRQGTLWFLNGSVGRSTNELVKGFRWCPECFKEMEHVGLDPYFKLVWHLSAITHCPVHATPFESQCSCCGCSQTSYRKSGALGTCQECGKALSVRAKPLVSSDLENSWLAKGADVLKLFSDVAHMGGYGMPEDGVSKSLGDIFDHYWRAEKEIDLYRLVDRDQMLRIIEDRQCISLKVARRVAYRLGVTLYALMSGEAIHSSSVLNADWVCEFPSGFVPVESKAHHNHDATLAALKSILNSAGRPPSKKEVARRLEVSIGYLDYRFAGLMSQIVKKHKDFTVNERLGKKLHARRAAIEFFVEPKYQDEVKSRKQAYKVLRLETGLPKFMLKDAINEVYNMVI